MWWLWNQLEYIQTKRWLQRYPGSGQHILLWRGFQSNYVDQVCELYWLIVLCWLDVQRDAAKLKASWYLRGSEHASFEEQPKLRCCYQIPSQPLRFLVIKSLTWSPWDQRQQTRVTCTHTIKSEYSADQRLKHTIHLSIPSCQQIPRHTWRKYLSPKLCWSLEVHRTNRRFPLSRITEWSL